MKTLAISCALAALALASPLVAQDCLDLDQRVEITDGTNLAHLAFGKFVVLSADGHRAFASSRNDQGWTGAVYVFRRDSEGWIEEQKLFSPHPQFSGEFGAGIACDAAGRRLVVLESNDAGGFGALHVYRREASSWTFEDTLALPGTALTVESYLPVAMNAAGDVVLVGYWLDFAAVGSALVYRRQGTSWSFERSLVPAAADADGSTFFGLSVELDASGDLAFVSSPGSSVVPGFTYAYERGPSGWRRLARIAAGDGVPSDNFHAVVASATGDTLVIGAPLHVPGGALYVFERSGDAWIEQAMLVPDATAERLGGAVDIDADGRTIIAIAVAGSQSDLEDAVYVFRRQGSAWLGEQLVPGAAFDQFQDVALGAWGAHAFVGAVPLNVSQHGIAFAFRCDEPLAFCPGTFDCACGPAGLPDRGCDTAAGTGGVRLAAAGFAPDGAGGGTLDLVADGFAPGASSTALALRAAQLERDGAPFARGVLCLTGTVQRLTATRAQAGSAAVSIAHDAGAGTFAYQLWFRDGAPSACAPGAANLSNALEVVWP